MEKAVISGTGLYTPPHTISNDELVAAFNSFVANYNEAHREQIEAGEMEPLLASSTDFILKASGIQNRRVMDKTGILDPHTMGPRLVPRA